MKKEQAVIDVDATETELSESDKFKVTNVAPGIQVISPDGSGASLQELLGAILGANDMKGADQPCQFDADGRCVSHDSLRATKPELWAFGFARQRGAELGFQEQELELLKENNADQRLVDALTAHIEATRALVLLAAQVQADLNPDKSSAGRS